MFHLNMFKPCAVDFSLNQWKRSMGITSAGLSRFDSDLLMEHLGVLGYLRLSQCASTSSQSAAGWVDGKQRWFCLVIHYTLIQANYSELIVHIFYSKVLGNRYVYVYIVRDSSICYYI